MVQDITSHHFMQGADDKLVPAGGHTYGPGLCIAWQHGPLGRGEDRQEPNGCFVETVIQAAIDRLEFYQRTQFACANNEMVLMRLNDAIALLMLRTADREARGVEGTHKE